ncbi:MAG: phospholipase [Acidobacteria bacterium]|nr:phospholipase [Acidobacteriota bacterium]
MRLEASERERIASVIARNIERLSAIRGFVDAEPGFPVVDGWVRREPAIIVHVEGKRPLSELLPEDVAPSSIENTRVDVLSVDPWRLLASDPRTADLFSQVEDVAAAGLTYELRPGNPIDTPFTIDRPILCHAGPDAGWPVLKHYIEGTRHTLTTAMYDVNAAYVAKTLIETVRAHDVRFVLTWDSGMTAVEGEIRIELKAKLGDKLDAWVVRTGGGYRFDSAYHEKVAVRDSSSFWLSSGNWSTRSQPDIDPIAIAGDARGMYSKGNREWHVVVDDAPLAKLFEAYIVYDRDKSEEEVTALAQFEPLMLPDLFVPAEDLQLDEEITLAAPSPVAPAALPTHGQPFSVQPVLCPDNYIARVTEFIQSARESLYLQFSYITYSTAPKDADFTQMLNAIGNLSHQTDFDLKIIVGNNSAEDKVCKLVEVGLNEEKIRIQTNVHNKGIIVDGKAVLVSSANWSSAGALRNRDAGIIIHDPEVARYYQDIFINDWENRARSDFGRPGRVRLALAGEPTPRGMVRIPWRDYVEN